MSICKACLALNQRIKSLFQLHQSHTIELFSVYAFGNMKPTRRKAFTIGLDFRAMFTPGDPTIVPCLALGFDSF